MGPAPDLLERRLLFFTGKGGVGKSTMAAAIAILAADRGRRVLLVDVDGKGDLATLFEHAPVGFAPAQVHPGVLAMSMDTEASLQEYLRLNLRVPVLGRIGPLARASSCAFVRILNSDVLPTCGNPMIPVFIRIDDL